MKKILLIFISVFCFFFISGCNKIKEYTGLPITKLTYGTIDFNGGSRVTYIFDFTNNNASRNSYLPGEDDENERVFDVFASFTDDEEKTFIDSCYSFGLFNLKDKYTTTEKIIDGGSWSLGIEYDDGSNKTSYGINAGPKNIFNKCTTVFYDLCGDGVVGIVPSNYYNTPNVSISFDLRYNNYNFSDNSLCSYAGWNKSESLNKDLYSINQNLSTRLLENYDYSVVLYIDNNGKNVKFKKCVVKCYDFNEDLDNEKIVLQRNWFSHVETKLEFNKIYFIELTFKDGDFVQYTFNTKPLNSKIIYGEYHYNISGEGYSVIKLNDDGTYILSPFNYYSYYVIENEIVIDDTIKELSGNYGFEIIDGKEYLCLYMNDNQKMVFDFCSMAIFLDFDKTTYDFSIYHLEGNIEFDGGRTTFDFRN